MKSNDWIKYSWKRCGSNWCKLFLRIVFLPKHKFFAFNDFSPVKDIHSVLEVTVLDEDRDKKFDFLGKSRYSFNEGIWTAMCDLSKIKFLLK